VATDGQAQSVEPATVNITQDFLDGAIDGTDGNDILVGKPNQGDIFFGNGGSDILIGENLSDTMSGGTGNDTLSGGEGNDGFTYSFTSPIVTSTDGLDTILDFTWGEDKLNFSGVTQAEFEANFDVDDSQDVTGDSQADTVMTINGSAGWSLTLAGVSGHDLTDFSNNAIMFS
jgi:Ca2+-binding RTX toxin-like protein